MSKELYNSPIKLAGGEERFVCPQALALNTYLGCPHDCVYCYAKDMLESVKKWKPIKPANIDVIRQTMDKAYKTSSQDIVSKLIRRKTPFRFANISDGFIEMERKYRCSYEALKIMVEYQHPCIINTKGLVIADDEYIELLKQFPCVVQMTITTDDEKMGKILEPNAPSVTDRIAIIKKLTDNGITIQVRYSPVYPKLTDDPRSLFSKVQKNGAKDIVCEMIRVPILSNQRKLLREGLGFDYIDYLRSKDYPIFKFKQQYRVEQPFIFDEYERFRKITKSYGLNFFVCCEEKPEINDWCNCCGTHQYKGFENGLKETIQMNGKKITKEGTSFEEYIEGIDCPYSDGFKKYWDSGKLEHNIYGMRFDPETKKYRRINPPKKNKLF